MVSAGKHPTSRFSPGKVELPTRVATALRGALLREIWKREEGLMAPSWNGGDLDNLPSPLELIPWVRARLASGRGFADEPPKEGSWERSEGSWSLAHCEERFYLWRVFAEMSGPENSAAAETIWEGLPEIAGISARLGALADPRVRL